MQKEVDYATRAAEEKRMFRKWNVLWRSIIASSLDHTRWPTYKPYCWHITTLDFRNLLAMLDDYKFTPVVQSQFFNKGLKGFWIPKKDIRGQVVDVVATVNKVGDALITKTPLLEEINGHMSPGYLCDWIPLSPKLVSMVLWNGDALTGTGDRFDSAGKAIAACCESFKSLTVHDWSSPDADVTCSSFLNDLNPDTLEYFEMISFNRLSKLSFEALGRHKSLRELSLGNLSHEAMENLNALKECTKLHTLKLDDDLGYAHLEGVNDHVFLEVVDWLSSCRNLRDLSLKKFADGPAILSRVLCSPNVKLTKLSLEGYRVLDTNSQLFHSALPEQRTLESICLKGSCEGTTSRDLRIMVEGLCGLKNLKELVLKDVSDEFSEADIATLAMSLPHLEDLWTSGGEVCEGVLDVLAGLDKLKNLTLYALTQFTSEGILNFLERLNPVTQKGFSLSLMAANPDFDLNETEQDLIREYIRTNLDGRFDFVLWRDAETSDSDDD